MFDFFKYGGLDWLATLLSLISIYLIGNRHKEGFLTFISANFLWIFLGFFWIQSYGIGVGHLIFLVMNSLGFLKWHREEIKKV